MAATIFPTVHRNGDTRETLVEQPHTQLDPWHTKGFNARHFVGGTDWLMLGHQWRMFGNPTYVRWGVWLMQSRLGQPIPAHHGFP